MNPSILAIATAVPPHSFSQHDIAEKMVDILNLDPEKAQQLRKIYENSSIQNRHSVIEDFKRNRSDWKFWGPDYPKSIPGMSERNARFKAEAPRLALECAEKALKNWGGNPKSITHLIFITCTGMVAPGIEFELMQKLHLNPNVNRLGINFMGCFGAFKGLSVGSAFAKENPKNRVLVVCTELCSLHFQNSLNLDNLVGNSLFSDGSAAVILGNEPQYFEKSLWTIVRNSSIAMENTTDKMSWEASDHGFLMTLSQQVPVLLKRHIGSFVETILGNEINSSECDWAIHPGGKSILQAIEKAMKLSAKQTQSSWDTLANYGNMSSATFLFVLERLLEMQTSNVWTLGLGFGPGLSMEGILLEKCKPCGCV
jgi:predicted naringenin-chalcone synthase